VKTAYTQHCVPASKSVPMNVMAVSKSAQYEVETENVKSWDEGESSPEHTTWSLGRIESA